MTKNDIAQLVADKVQKTDEASLVLLRSFIDRRYDMIWNSALWRESLSVDSQTIAVADEGIVTLATELDFPVSARWDDKEITPISYSAVFQIDPTLFNDAGTVANFIVLPKADGDARIKLLRKPSVSKDILILGKLKLVALDVVPPNDVPKINGIDNVLLGMVEGDMLEHLRQYNKAQLKFTEAMNQLTIAKDLEKHQSASNTRIIPMVEEHWNSDSLV